MIAELDFAQLLSRLRDGLATLPDKPEETAESTLRALWHAAAGEPLSAERALEAPLPELDAPQRERLHALVAGRLSGTPLAHLTERQYFLGLELLAGPEALIPRKETELLASTAIGLLQRMKVLQPLVVDVCTGSGNVAIAVASRVAEARVLGADLSADAVRLARRNAEHAGLGNRVSFRDGDLLAPFDRSEFHGTVDLLTCNPPYISSANVARMPGEIALHEPRLAFDGGPFGVSVLMRLLRDAPRYLRSAAWLVFEVGLGQGPSLLRMLAKHPEFEHAEGVSDSSRVVRVIAARRR